MNILITGAAGNLGSLLAHHLLGSGHNLKLMVHRTPLPEALAAAADTSVVHADLAHPETLKSAVADIDGIIHFAGRLFAPRPESFLYETNVVYVRNLLDAAVAARVGKFILVSFPHVEGESTPRLPAQGLLQGKPTSVHAQTRLAAEKHLFQIAADTQLTPIALRPGMIYAHGVLMIDAARRLMKRRLLGVWTDPTWIHTIALPDFLSAATAALEFTDARGIYNLGDERPLTLQSFLDQIAAHWRFPRPWRAPVPVFYLAAGLVEFFAALTHKPAPLTRDFIRIGRASYVMDISRMKQELLPELQFPDLTSGIHLL